MPVDTNGNASRPPSPLPVSGQTADAPQVNVPVDDIYSILNLLAFLDGRKPLRGNQDFNGYKVTGAADGTSPQDYVTKAQMESAIAAVSVIAPGIMLPYTISSSAAPVGFLFANGQAVSRATYAALWAAVSAGNNLAASEGAKTAGQYGPGDGSTTFTLPDLYADNGYFIRPVSSGRTIGTVQADEIKSHGHTASFTGNPVPNHDHGVGAQFIGSGIGSTGGYITNSESGVDTSPAGGHTPSGLVTVTPTGGTETRPKNIAYPVLIKT